MTRLAGASLVATGCEITHYASRGEAHRVRELLQRGADPNGIEPEKNESSLVPMIAAARIGDLEMVRLFVECGAKCARVENGTKSNILHVSIQHGHVKLVRYLIGALSDSQLRQLAGQTDSEGRTPLRIAAWEGVLDIVQAIKPYSALNQVRNYKPERYLNSSEAGYGAEDALICRVLYAASRSGEGTLEQWRRSEHG